MAKKKQQQLVSAPARKKNRQGAREVDFLSADGWMVVKKQKITILIPPLPASEELTMPNAEVCEPEVSLRKTTKTLSEYSDKSYSQKHSVSEREKSLSPAPESAIPAAKMVCPQPTHSFPKLSLPRHSVSSGYPEINNLGGQKSIGVFSAMKARKQALIFSDGNPLLNQRMRAINIEKKVQRAGGLSSWLASLGLERFVRIFQQKNVNKFQLANLTMKKLKDMGADAVGPRRKLMHAIDCLCQPYCFERFSVD
ncbi:hypothetical protein ACH5RR_005730 [Cinchona calisaya]|uniref:SAM domain-containing protein n=1 Tax=Cinchona calisaya TaxID=153742 RepID=A0ABD3AM07_9GENT